MAEISLRELNKAIKEDALAPVYLFHGPEMNLAEKSIDRIIQAATSQAMRVLNVSRFKEKGTAMEEVLNVSQTYPVMSPKRVVIVENSCGFLELSEKSALEQLENYLKNPSESTILIFLSEKPNKSRKIYKLLKSQATLVLFDKLDEDRLIRWIAKQVTQHNRSISRKGAIELIQRTHYLDNESVSTVRIEKEIEKLCATVGEGEMIEADSIASMIAPTLQDNVFEITRLIGQGKINEAVEMFRGFLIRGESELAIFGILIHQVRQMLHLLYLEQERIPDAQICSKIGCSKYHLKHIRALARSYSISRLEELIRDASESDLKMKTGQIDSVLLVEIYFLKLNKKR